MNAPSSTSWTAAQHRRSGLNPGIGWTFVVLSAADGWGASHLWHWFWPVALPLGWLSFAMLLAGLAYLRLGPGVFGKRRDGTRALWATVVLAPYLILCRVSWGLVVLSREPVCHEVFPGVFLGRRARARELPPEINLVVDLTAEFLEPRGVLTNRAYRTLPTLDGCATEAGALRALVDELEPWPGKIYVHCAVGRGRSSTFAAALLIARGLAEGAEQAEAALKKVRPVVKLTARQRALLTELLRS